MANAKTKLQSYSNRKRVPFTCSEEELTKQYFKQETDINVIIGRYMDTGIMPEGIRKDPQYGFAPNIELKDAMDLVNSAKADFAKQNEFDNFDDYVHFMTNFDPEAFEQKQAELAAENFNPDSSTGEEVPSSSGDE